MGERKRRPKEIAIKKISHRGWNEAKKKWDAEGEGNYRCWYEGKGPERLEQRRV